MHKANCTEKHRRQTISDGERKGYSEEEPSSREEQVVVTAPAQAVTAQAGLEEESGVKTMTVMMMTPTSAERPAKVHHQSQWWPAKSHTRRPQVTLQLTGSCHPSTSLALKREPSWATPYWIGPMSRRGRSTRHECRGGW